jgi:hypothetical protein
VASQKGASPARCVDSGEVRSADQLGGPVGSHNSASRDSLQILVSPTGRGRKWRAALNGKVLCVSTSPLITSARILMSQGFDPNCIVEMVRAGTNAWSLRGGLEAVAAILMDGETASRSAKNGVPVHYFQQAGKRPPPGTDAMHGADRSRRFQPNKSRPVARAKPAENK